MLKNSSASPTRTENRAAALRLAGAGLFVFPCKVEKKPAPGFLWQDWASNDPAEVREIWDHYGSDCAPALHLGPPGLIVVDLDVKKANGIEAFDRLLDQYGGDLSLCPATATPSGGFHLPFRQPLGRAPLGNATGSLPDGIDIRGNGGYVLAPGAILDDGQYYEGVAGWPNLIEAFTSGSIPIIPQWLIDLIEAQPDGRPSLGRPSEARWTPGSPVAGVRNARRATSYIEVPLNDYRDRLAGMPAETGRNNFLNEAVFYISGLIHCPTLANNTISKGLVWDAMSWAYGRHPSRKRGARSRFRATFESAWRAGIAQPCRGPAPDPVSDIEIRLR
jgi:hypothetical protein